MSKYQIQFDVTLRVAKTVRAESLEDAMVQGRELAKVCPVSAKLVKIGAGIEYLWNDETALAGVADA